MIYYYLCTIDNVAPILEDIFTPSKWILVVHEYGY